ncbi:hypothetical protein VNO80_01247 [Phaseolus coccineus]|uniref:Uncharacterized protein n=1 Tax=Phaseolus coccineus TaxID=3886 RepID=A0AAN9P0F7_PHACN
MNEPAKVFHMHGVGGAHSDGTGVFQGAVNGNATNKHDAERDCIGRPVHGEGYSALRCNVLHLLISGLELRFRDLHRELLLSTMTLLMALNKLVHLLQQFVNVAEKCGSFYGYGRFMATDWRF